MQRGLNMARLCTWIALAAVGLVVSGCYTDFGPVVTGQSVEIVDSAAPTRVAGHIQAGDKIKLTVYGEDTLSGLYEISPSGTVSLPLGMTVTLRTP